jgi:hypothetical protein
MFSNLLRLISRLVPPGYDTGFVREIRVRKRSARNPRIERLLWLCWGLITIKCVVVFWAVRHYTIPFSPYWVVGPTIIFALLATALYYRRP